MKSSRLIAPGLLLAAIVSLPLTAAAQASHTYTGNGATGFSGYLGKGSLTVSSDKAGNITFLLAPHGGSLGGNALALYIDSTAGGFADTSQFSDNSDPGHEIISGANTGTNPGINGKNRPSRSLVIFPPGFKADYALSFEDGYVGLFKLAAGKNNALIYITGAKQKRSPYKLTIPGSKIGAGPGKSFKFVGSLISGTKAYRSNETLGATKQGSRGAVPGFKGSITFTGFETFRAAAH